MLRVLGTAMVQRDDDVVRGKSVVVLAKCFRMSHGSRLLLGHKVDTLPDKGRRVFWFVY